MALEVSKKTNRTAKAAGLEPEDMAFADLIAVGWSAEDAFFVAYRKGMTWMKDILEEQVEIKKTNEYIIRRIDFIRGTISQQKVEASMTFDKSDKTSIVDAAMSKEQMLFDLQTALAGMKAGSKEWLDTKKLIVDVTRMKQDEIQKEDSTIHYFLPVKYPTSCQDCLYSRCDACKYKKAKQGK